MFVIYFFNIFFIFRDIKTTAVYEAHKNEVKMEWSSLDSYLEHSIFKIPYHVDENGLKTTKYVETVGKNKIIYIKILKV